MFRAEVSYGNDDRAASSQKNTGTGKLVVVFLAGMVHQWVYIRSFLFTEQYGASLCDGVPQ